MSDAADAFMAIFGMARVTGRVWSFDVRGQPATKGSYRAIVTRGKTKAGGPKAITLNDNAKCKGWQVAIGWAAKAKRATPHPFAGAVDLSVMFEVERTRNTRRARFPPQDVDKMLRALLDGMTGIVYEDDRQVIAVRVRKEWAGVEGPGVTVTVTERPSDENIEQPAGGSARSA